MFLRIPGVEGSVSGGKYDRCYPIDSFQFGVGRGVGSPTRRKRRGGKQKQEEENEREISVASVSEITLTMDKMDAHVTFLFGLNLAGVCFPIIELFVDDNKYTLQDVIISGFSLSSGGRRQRCSLSLNFAGMSTTTKSVFRRPVTVPNGIPEFGLCQPHERFYGIGPLIFSFLEQQDLWNAARTCVLWLWCASKPSLQKEKSSTWSYEISTSQTTLDGFKLPKVTKGEGLGYNDDDNNVVDENEKAQEKSKEELEQSIIREDLKKSPFAFLFPSKIKK